MLRMLQVPTPIPPGHPVQAYTLRTAAVAALMLAPAMAHARPATAARRAAAQARRSGSRLSKADVRRYGVTTQEIALEDRFASNDSESVALMRADQAAVQAMCKELGARAGDDASEDTSDDAPAR